MFLTAKKAMIKAEGGDSLGLGELPGLNAFLSLGAGHSVPPHAVPTPGPKWPMRATMSEKLLLCRSTKITSNCWVFALRSPQPLRLLLRLLPGFALDDHLHFLSASASTLAPRHLHHCHPGPHWVLRWAMTYLPQPAETRIGLHPHIELICSSAVPAWDLPLGIPSYEGGAASVLG